MNSDYLKAFVVGSSFVTLLHFFLSVMKISEEVRNYSYEDYTLIAPLYLGLMNMFGLWLARQLGLTGEWRYLLIGLISGLIVATIATVSKSYNFTPDRWAKYYTYIVLKHIATYFLIMQVLELSI